MRTKIVVALTLLLVGCQSGFDRCMDTELPRAEITTGLEAERQIGRELVAFRSRWAKVYRVATYMKLWIEENPAPSDPEWREWPKWNCTDKVGREWFDCAEAHKKLVEEWDKRRNVFESSPRWQAWVETKHQEWVRLARENGILINNEWEYDSHMNKLLESVEAMIEPRSAIYRCLSDRECIDYTGTSEHFAGSIMKASNEAILNNASKISELVKTTKELAVVTCNNNGFYE